MICVKCLYLYHIVSWLLSDLQIFENLKDTWSKMYRLFCQCLFARVVLPLYQNLNFVLDKNLSMVKQINKVVCKDYLAWKSLWHVGVNLSNRHLRLHFVHSCLLCLVVAVALHMLGFLTQRLINCKNSSTH